MRVGRSCGSVFLVLLLGGIGSARAQGLAAPSSVPSQPSPALAKRADDAKAAGKALDGTALEFASCRQLGQLSRDSNVPGLRGRARIRLELRKAAVESGASHVVFSDYQDGAVQREAASIYDCSGPAPTPAPGARTASRSGAISVQLDVVPGATVSADTSGRSQDIDITSTFGVSASLDRFVSPFVSIGFAPGVIFGIQSEGATDSATELDLRLRLRIGNLVNDGFTFNGYVSAGASWIFFPMAVQASGATVGFGVAANYPISGAGFITFDLGYQAGAQSISSADAGETELSSRFLHFGIGVGSFL